MNIEFIQKLCLAFPHATENLQWGDVLCFKIGGKLFAVLDLSSVPPCLSFKCDSGKVLGTGGAGRDHAGTLLRTLSVGFAGASGGAAMVRVAGTVGGIICDGGGEGESRRNRREKAAPASSQRESKTITRSHDSDLTPTHSLG